MKCARSGIVRWWTCAATGGGLPLLLACTQGESGAAATVDASPTIVSPQAADSASPKPFDVSPDIERSCRQICDRSRRLQCANTDKCMPNCLAMAQATPCSSEMRSLYECLKGQPIQNWECAPDGVAAIREGFCDGEQGRTVACMQAKMQQR